jgi:hypothetical protein
MKAQRDTSWPYRFPSTVRACSGGGLQKLDKNRVLDFGKFSFEKSRNERQKYLEVS